MIPLPLSFYRRPALTVARELLGKFLFRDSNGRTAGGIIVETEAYTGREDAACHAYKLASPTPGHRTAVMFQPGGCVYVYLIYGMYCCFNVVTGGAGSPEAVLVRALEPTLGLEEMMARRRTRNPKKLCSGPGKLCMALAISRADSGADLSAKTLFIADSDEVSEALVARTPRVNVAYSGSAAALPFRFVVRDSAFLSTKKGL